MRYPVGALAVLLLMRGAVHADTPRAIVGVIAPQIGRSAIVGDAHWRSTNRGFRELNWTVKGPNGEITLVPVRRDDKGKSYRAAQAAKKLVKQGAVAILGPVNSNSTIAVLAEALEVPVVSPLSTAPRLTDVRNPWFFRATINDRDRMASYAEYVNKHLENKGQAVLLYENDAYGKGLFEALRDRLTEPVLFWTWGELGADGTTEGWKRIADGGGLSDAVLRQLPEGPVDVFVLGTHDGTTAICSGLDRRLRATRGAGLRFLSVAETKQSLEEAPEGSITIGDPWFEELEDEQFVDDAETIRVFKQDPDQYVLTSFEVARFVLPTAIEYVLQDGGSLNDLPAFRRLLRDELQNREFDSLVPWRKIHFQSDGSLEEPPVPPIIRVQHGLQRLDEKKKQPTWFRLLDIPPVARFLEAPVSVTVERRPPGDDDSIEMEVLSGDERFLAKQQVRLKGGKGRFDYYPTWTGAYQVKVGDTKAQAPSQARFAVRWTWAYPSALAGAIAGLLLATSRPSPLRWPHRAAIGILTGLALFALSSLGRDSALASYVPLPSFHTVPAVNAFLVGLVGGWGGLELLLRIVQAITGIASGRGGKYAGTGVSDPRKLQTLEDENRQLRTLVAELRLDNETLKAVARKEAWPSPDQSG